MAASGVGAAIALAAVARPFAGEIVFLGTPAEERGCGKEIMIDDGLFEGLDAALLYHPCDRNHVECQPLASRGRLGRVHRACSRTRRREPWEGRNALDAMIALFSSVGPVAPAAAAARRVHGIIQEGGTAANIIPDRTRAWFMVRSADQAYYEVMKERFRRLCEAAAIAADVEVEVEFSGFASTMKTNRAIADRWVANAAAYGIEDQGPDGTSGSTDMANVSWAVPAIHPDLVDHGRRAPRATRSSSATRRPAPRRRDGPAWRPRSSPRPRSTCSSTRRSSRAPGASSRASELTRDGAAGR